MADAEDRTESITIVPNFRRVKGTKLFRSSKLDNLEEEGLVRLKGELGVNTVLDLRSPEGWEDTGGESQTGPSPVDDSYQPISVVYETWTQSISNTFTRGARAVTSFQYKVLKGRGSREDGRGSSSPTDHGPPGRRLFLNLIDKEFALGVLRDQLPWYQIPWIVTLMIAFLICRTKLFLKEFARLAMNPMGIRGQYQGVITYCGQSLNACLTLLSEPGNVPSVICCAQGKDRTGILSALLMAVCGATRDDIIHEYAASQDHLVGLQEIMQNYIDCYYLKPEFGTAYPATMEGLLDFIDQEYGSIPEYLESIGFDRKKQELLRENIQQQ